MPLAPPPAAARPLTRLQLRSTPMIALAFAVSALVASLPLILVIVLGARANPSRPPALAASVAVVVLLGLIAQAIACGPVLWRLGRRRLVRSGRRWLALASLAAGFAEGALIATVFLTHNPRPLIDSLEILFALGGFVGLSGALGGLVLGLLATRRAPLEAVFE